MIQFRHRGKVYIALGERGRWPTVVHQHLRRRPIAFGLFTLFLWLAAWRALVSGRNALPPARGG